MGVIFKGYVRLSFLYSVQTREAAQILFIRLKKKPIAHTTHNVFTTISTEFNLTNYGFRMKNITFVYV